MLKLFLKNAKFTVNSPLKIILLVMWFFGILTIFIFQIPYDPVIIINDSFIRISISIRIFFIIISIYFLILKGGEKLKGGLDIQKYISSRYSFKARILIFLGRSQEALEVIDKGFGLFPDYLDFYELRNMILSHLGRYSKALKGIEEAIKRGSNYSGIYNEKADLLHYLNRFDVAIETVNKALEINPEDSESYYLKILILIQLEKYDEAFEVLEQNKT